MPDLLVPVVVIALAIPMILGIVPPNGVYGFRTSYTLSSDEVWYRANRISGIALVVAGVVWAGFVLLLPKFLRQEHSPLQWAGWLGFSALMLSVAISFWLVYRRRAG